MPTIENGGISRDGLTITYHMRKGAKWSDGVPVTSKDVKWSWQAIMNPNNNVVSRHGYDFVEVDRHAGCGHRRGTPQIEVRAICRLVLCDERSAVLRSPPEHVLSKYPNINQNFIQQRAGR